MDTRAHETGALPQSDVSAGVGLAGLLGLFAWILFCRTYPLTAEWLDLPGPREVLSGPHAALAAMALAMTRSLSQRISIEHWAKCPLQKKMQSAIAHRRSLCSPRKSGPF